MKKIEKGIVFSDDINRILNGKNAFDYVYESVPGETVIECIRKSFLQDVNKIFKKEVTVITEEEMSKINKLIGGEYPHCYIG